MQWARACPLLCSFLPYPMPLMGFPCGSEGRVCLQCGRPEFERSRREENSNPLQYSLSLVFLPGKCHGQRTMAGYRPQRCKKSEMAECTHMHAHAHVHTHTHTHTHMPIQHCNNFYIRVIFSLKPFCVHQLQDIINTKIECVFYSKEKKITFSSMVCLTPMFLTTEWLQLHLHIKLLVTPTYNKENQSSGSA